MRGTYWARCIYIRLAFESSATELEPQPDVDGIVLQCYGLVVYEGLAGPCSVEGLTRRGFAPQVDLNVIDKDKEVTVGEPAPPPGRARSPGRPTEDAPSPRVADGRGHAPGPRKSWVRSNSRGALHSPSECHLSPFFSARKEGPGPLLFV